MDLMINIDGDQRSVDVDVAYTFLLLIICSK
jgi:hypothetical protein